MKHISILLACLFAVNAYAQPTIGKPNINSAMSPEDTAHVSGDWGVPAWGVANASRTNLSSADGDYTPIAVDVNGGLYLAYGANSIAALEDAAHASGDTGTKILGVREDALTVSAGTTGDYGNIKIDAVGRQITTMAPASETFMACSTTSTGQTDTAIKAAVASNRIYVTSITCSNTSTVPSEIKFKDGSTTWAIGAIPALSVGGNYSVTFPVPFRGTVNTAFNFAMTTTATATTCCAHGYISVN